MSDKAFVAKNGLVVNTNLIWANNGQVGINNSAPNANLTVTGTANVSGNVALSGANTYVAQHLTVNTDVTVGNSTVNVFANSTTISVGANVDINSTAVFVGNSTVNTVLDQDSLVVGNTTVNSTQISVGANVIANTTSLAVGNSTVNVTINSTAIDTGLVVTNSTVLTVGSNVVVNTSAILIGNSTVNVVANSSTVLAGIVTVNATAVTVGANASVSATQVSVGNSTVNSVQNSAGFYTGTSLVNSTALAAGANVYANTSAIQIGNSTVNVVANSSTVLAGIASLNTTAVAVGANVVLSSAQVSVGNSTINAVHNSAGFFTGTTIANSTALAAGANVVLTTAQMTVGNSTVNTYQNSTGFFTGTSTVNSTAVAAGANVVLSTTSLAVGNSTANVFANSILVKVANSTGTTNVQPGVVATGAATLNSTAAFVGNTVLTDGVVSVGNSTVNVVANTTTIKISGGTQVNATVVNTTTANVTTLVAGNSTVSSTANSLGFFTGTVVANGTNVAVGANVVLSTTEVSVGNSTSNTRVQQASINVGASSVNSTVLVINGTSINGTSYPGTANDSTNLGGSSAASYAKLAAVQSFTANQTFTGGLTNVAANLNVGSSLNVGPLLANQTVVSITGTSTTVAANSTVVLINAAANSTTANVTLGGTLVTVSSNTKLTGANTDVSGQLTALASANVVGDLRIGGNLIVVGNTTSSGVSAGDLIPASNSYALGNTTNRWTLYSMGIDVAGGVVATGSGTFGNIVLTASGLMTIGNSTVNVTSNSTVLTVGSMVVNTTSIASGANVVLSTTGLRVGNSTINTVLTSTGLTLPTGSINSTTYTGTSNNSLYLGGTVAASYALLGAVQSFTANQTFSGALTTVSGNAVVGGTNLTVGNSTINVAVSQSQVFIGNSTVSATVNSSAFSGTANNASNLGGVAAASYAQLGAVQSFTANQTFSGTLTTITAAANLVGDTATLQIGNSTVSATVNSTVFSQTANNANYFGGSLPAVYAKLASVQTFTANQTFSGALTTINTAANVSGDAATLRVGNSTVFATVNATNYTGTANNATNLGGTVAASYAQLGAVQTFTANQTFSGALTTITGQATIAVLYVGNSTVFSTVNTTFFSQTANNANNLGGVAAASYAQLGAVQTFTANQTFSGAITTIGTAANVTGDTATLRVGNSTVFSTVNSTAYSGTVLNANNSSYLGGVAAASYAQLAAVQSFTANQTFNGAITTVNLSLNVATATTGATLRVGNSTVFSTINSSAFSGQSATALSANDSSYLGGVAAAGYAELASVQTFTANQTLGGTLATVSANLNVSGAVANLSAQTNINDGVLWIRNTGVGTASVTSAADGLNLVANAMTVTTAGYFPAIKFLSSDASFTTQNPKLLAYIVARATETFVADTSGGTAIDFYATANAAGATATNILAMSVGANTVEMNVPVKLNTDNSVIMATPSTGSTSALARTCYYLASYKSVSATTTGAIVFRANSLQVATQIISLFEISGFVNSAGANLMMVTVGANKVTNAAAYTNTQIMHTGSLRPMVRLGVDPNGFNCVILGDTTTVWNVPHFVIERARFSGGGVTDQYASGWQTSLVTDLSLYTQLTSDLTAAGTDGSYSALANNATNLGGVAAASYAQLAAVQTFTANQTFNGAITTVNLSLNVASATTGSTIRVGNSTVFTTINATAFTGLANDSTNLGGAAASTYAKLASVQTFTANQTFSGAITTIGTAANVTGDTATVRIGNSTVFSTVNSTVFSQTANNATNLGGSAAAAYAKLATVQTFTANQTFSGALTTINTAANVSGDAATLRVGNSTVFATVNATNYTGTANNATNLGGTVAASYALLAAVQTFTANQSISSTDAGATRMPQFELYRNSASPAAADYLGNILFSGQSSTGVKRSYGDIAAKIEDATNASEDASMVFSVISAGTLTERMTLFSNGQATAVNFSATSDRRLKSNFQEITDALEILEKTTGLRYLKNGLPSIGFIAQDVEEFFPEIVSVDPDGWYSLNYDGYVPILVEGVKALKSKVDTLEEQLAALLKRVEKLEGDK